MEDSTIAENMLNVSILIQPKSKKLRIEEIEEKILSVIAGTSLDDYEKVFIQKERDNPIEGELVFKKNSMAFAEMILKAKESRKPSTLHLKTWYEGDITPMCEKIESIFHCGLIAIRSPYGVIVNCLF